MSAGPRAQDGLHITRRQGAAGAGLRAFVIRWCPVSPSSHSVLHIGNPVWIHSHQPILLQVLTDYPANVGITTGDQSLEAPLAFNRTRGDRHAPTITQGLPERSDTLVSPIRLLLEGVGQFLQNPEYSQSTALPGEKPRLTESRGHRSANVRVGRRGAPRRRRSLRTRCDMSAGPRAEVTPSRRPAARRRSRRAANNC
jgi:hypothetical protein